LITLLISLAAAAPQSVTQQGRLLDTSGVPINGSQALTFTLYDALTGGAAGFTATQTVALDSGYYSVVLSGLTPADLAGDRWLEIATAGSPLGARQPLTSVPYAIRSTQADSVVLADNVATCDGTTPALHGALRYHAGTFEGCTPTGWTPLAVDPVGSRTNPGVTCATILAGDASSPSSLSLIHIPSPRDS